VITHAESYLFSRWPNFLVRLHSPIAACTYRHAVNNSEAVEISCSLCRVILFPCRIQRRRGKRRQRSVGVLDEAIANAMVSADVFLLEEKTAVIETPSGLDWGEDVNQDVD
jgi:hypothetical protein